MKTCFQNLYKLFVEIKTLHIIRTLFTRFLVSLKDIKLPPHEEKDAQFISTVISE